MLTCFLRTLGDNKAVYGEFGKGNGDMDFQRAGSLVVRLICRLKFFLAQVSYPFGVSESEI